MAFAHKKAVVTGAGRGIGRAITEALAREGATVVALSRTQSALDSFKMDNVIPVRCDVSNLEETRELLQPHLPCDYLVNNAGINILEPFLDLTEEAFDNVMNTNLKGAIFLTQSVAKSMIDHQIRGSIVHISSQASKIPIPKHFSYMCSKAALDSCAKSMTFELGGYGIRVNCINPTVVLTDLGKRDWSDPVKAKPLLGRIPLGTFAEVQDVVDAALFLLSDQSKMITGTCLPIDGGCTAC